MVGNLKLRGGFDMGRWLTDNSRLEKSDKPNKWFLLDNELYQDDESSIYLAAINSDIENN